MDLDTKYGSCITDRVRVWDHSLPVDNPLYIKYFFKIAFCKNCYISLRGAITSFTLGHLLEWSLSSLGTKFGGVTINGGCMGNKYSSCAIFTCG